MFEKIMELMERGVVALELIAANSAKQPANVTVSNNTSDTVEVSVKAAEGSKELPVEGEDVVDTKPEPEKKTRKSRAAKAEEKEVDYDDLRKQIGVIDDAISEGPEDKACDEVDELLEEFTGDTMKLAAIADKDLAAFLAGITKIRDKYYDVE